MMNQRKAAVKFVSNNDVVQMTSYFLFFGIKDLLYEINDSKSRTKNISRIVVTEGKLTDSEKTILSNKNIEVNVEEEVSSVFS
jgi:hypothetical protein